MKGGSFFGFKFLLRGCLFVYNFVGCFFVASGVHLLFHAQVLV